VDCTYVLYKIHPEAHKSLVIYGETAVLFKTKWQQFWEMTSRGNGFRV